MYSDHDSTLEVPTPTPQRGTTSTTRLQGRRLLLARIVWGVLVVLRRSDDWMALLVAFFLVYSASGVANPILLTQWVGPVFAPTSRSGCVHLQRLNNTCLLGAALLLSPERRGKSSPFLT